MGSNRHHPAGEEKRKKVEQFLKDFRNLIDERQCFILKRYKNSRTMESLGLTVRQCEDLIYFLSPENFVEGPVKDTLHPGQYWVFGLKVEDNELYIKLKISMSPNDEERGICYSFHIAEYQMQYPFQPSNKS